MLHLAHSLCTDSVHGARDEGRSKEERNQHLQFVHYYLGTVTVKLTYIIPNNFQNNPQRKYNNYLHSAEEKLRKSKVRDLLWII